ncbi:alpha/beta hydrolase [Actinokineospora sp. PR83]|uniref:alpha/beta fold hydrolase n=1 Tax=Actinokineospora sp. PR83 TaxID=2884908 RepID=UPI001F32C337|nr:alpha/beta hydrolase [Actinokineospora sp. PR83]MCG8916058.1 alpha/beta hydrolase [Actinokineospora sp. PR83]
MAATGGVIRIRDGRELFHVRTPGPGPTVVFEAGLAATRSYWAPVRAALAGAAATVAYDRSGLGRSAPAPGPRDLPTLAADLNDLLTALGPGPYVLVGHSWGGPIVRVAAAAEPARVAGLLLLDPTDEAGEALFTPSMRRAERAVQLGSAAPARVGLLGVAFRGLLAGLPEDAAAEMRAEAFTPAAVRTRAAELRTLAADVLSLRDNPCDLPDVPLTVVSAGLTTAGMPARVRAEIEASHRHRAATSTRGRHVVAHRSGHMVPVSEPELVADEIRRLLAV